MKIKRIVSAVLLLCMTAQLASCTQAGSKNIGESPAAGTGTRTDIAFIVDNGGIDDQSFNQYSWQGIRDYCAQRNLLANYYKASEDSDAAREEEMETAVGDGAKVVVMAGYLFGTALGAMQKKYPDVQFLALDVSTGNLADPLKNSALITYREEQAGYLAGYAAVADGYRKLGYLGGMAIPSVIRYGYGYVQGADAAAKERKLTDVSMKYWYSGSFTANDDIKAKMDSWYSEETEVIFCAGGAIVNSCLAAAQANEEKIIGVDVDQSGLDECVVTSAMKGLAYSVQLALADCEKNGWKWSADFGGKENKLGVAENCVALPMETSRFTEFSDAQYQDLLKRIGNGSLQVDSSFDQSVTPAVTNISVDYQT